MKITNSAVSMTSGHELRVSEEKSSMTLNINDEAVKDLFTPLRAKMDSFQSSTERFERSEQRTESAFRAPEERSANVIRISSSQASEQRTTVAQSQESAESAALCMTGSVRGPSGDIKADLEDMKANVLRKMLELLRGVKKEPLSFGELTKGRMLDLRTSAYKSMGVRVQLFSADAENLPQAQTTSAGTAWRKVTSTTFTHSESEATSFQSQGLAVTEDGRALHFDVGFSLSRSFTANYERVKTEKVIMTDPLIISLGDSPASLSGAKFDFDLDGDGQRENISFAGADSGFLAIDANGNGVIDDGSELFGTKSGDGFADLAAYDDDGNGWIDENDAVYSKLRVWTRDADGAEKLMDLKEADVGAIYLDSAQTEFSLNDAATNENHGIMRKTGVYLRESGGAGTLSHVDLHC